MTPSIVPPAAAWTTVWPAWVAAVMLLWALVICRRDFLLFQRAWVWGVALALLVVVVRVLWIPAASEHLYDGHEADYLDFFLGGRSPNRGGTVLYPAMQWLYWLAGRVLSGRGWPVVMALLASLASVFFGACLAFRWFGARAGLWTGVLLALYGNHAFWSSSAYNVMIPLALMLASLWGVARLSVRGEPRFALFAAAAGALAVATRLESVLVAVPAVALLVRGDGRVLPTGSSAQESEVGHDRRQRQV